MTQQVEIGNGLALLEKGSAILQQLLKKLADESMQNGKLNNSLLDKFQVEAYRLGVLYAQYQAAKQMGDYAKVGVVENALSVGYVGLVLQAMREQFAYCSAQLDTALAETAQFAQDTEVTAYIKQTTGSEFAGKTLEMIDQYQTDGSYNLGEEHALMQEMFRSFAEDKVRPIAEELHRKDMLIPEEIINGVKDMDCFGLSIPGEYGGFSEQEDNIGIVVVTEELSRGALIVGSLITRPDILAKAILKGGTEEQKQKWLPLLASGEKLCAVAVTEPNVGSNVAGVSTVAKKVDGGWVLNGVKTWCTFAARADLMMVLARTEPDPNLKHKGLSILIAEKPVYHGHDFEFIQEGGGKASGRAIATIGYRGMHSYEVSLEDFFVPEENLIGLDEGRGNGFYFQMAGFSGGRLQTAARALGVMQAAYEAGKKYAHDRQVFDVPLVHYNLTKVKLAHMAMTIQACRQLTYHAARLMNEQKGQTEASMIKLLACRQAEWITREAMQIHGGMGYAEEYAVSRYFTDARVLSIFEGAEEVLALRVLIPALLKDLA